MTIRSALAVIAAACLIAPAPVAAADAGDTALIRKIAQSMTNIPIDAPYSQVSPLLSADTSNQDCVNNGFCHYFDHEGRRYIYVADENSKNLASIEVDVAKWGLRDLNALGLKGRRNKAEVIAQARRFTGRTLRCHGQLCAAPIGDGQLSLTFSASGRLESVGLILWFYT